ncbi:hypothetical protein AVEN_27623-1 [Araneus ventricosus]|uniref:Peptidase aspartic putative domain-containing protein n=1 Tax=Araneus ventricosus TaxID=182803 RepID=A0A4Y2EMV1_ARAVE|nr:hypothetical protein AVEN_27623-1 [Araneus ventricosus]
MTITELNRKQTAYKNELKKFEQFINAFQVVDENKDYIELKFKFNSVNDILKELDNLQREYCALPAKVKLNDALDILSHMEEDAEKLKDAIILHVLNNKIDKESQILLQLSLTTTQVPSLQGFLSFLDLSSFHNTKLHRDKTDVSIPWMAERFIDMAPKVNSEQCFALRSTDNKNSKPMKYLMSMAVAYVNGMTIRIILDSGSEKFEGSRFVVRALMSKHDSIQEAPCKRIWWELSPLGPNVPSLMCRGDMEKGVLAQMSSSDHGSKLYGRPKIAIVLHRNWP